jgi:DNA topoisomerase-2
MEYVMDASPPVDIIGDAAAAAAPAPATLTRRNITYIPGLYKLFDEGMVNMRDHVVRQAQAVADGKPDALPVTTLEVEIDPADGTIHMTNDGNGIDVAQHPEHKLWVPEMIFGHLRTSTNYDENKKEKIVGGKNGFGFKLVLIWSVWGRVETVDHIRGLKYVQEFRNNLSEIVPPVITKSKVKPYTRVSFRPDYARFGLPSNNLTPDMIALFMKRTYDIAAVTDKSVKVKYNGALVPVRHFQQYVDLYIGAKVAGSESGSSSVKRIYENPDPRWEYVVCLTTTDEFAHVSFVNGIYTPRGGKHVEYITNQIVRKLAEVIKKKKKVDVKPNTIKEQLMLFLRCDIENPSFSSQTKDELGTAVANFGSSCKVSDEFIEKLAKMGVMDAACALTEVKDTKAAKKTDGAKTKTIRGIPKLIDANYAGSADKSAQCTIILCEGDSAKAGIISGLSKEDRNYIGVYPMKGKLFNVHGETTKRISENREIAEIKQILGLETGKTYTSADVATRLRYGKVLFMTDQDLDGAHIQGLGINLFQTEWPSLTKIPGFIGFMNTPILKARRGAQEILFYNDGEYEAWKKQFPGEVVPSGWNTKYYKGLGTSTGKEFKEYFEHKKMVSFVHTGKESDDHLDMAFNKKRADDRKEWLANYSREAFLDTSKPEIPYEEFIDRGLIHFSIYDNERSIPNLMDGLKISLRKILYAAFKKGGLKTEIKVAQFSGYVSEHSAYHHGEASLNAAIVGMAQNFVGSNNINLLEPNGQFGTRVSGGDDSASERYIFTQLNKLTRLIYRQEDDAVLSYIDDDGQMVEPIYYAPAIPMILVNGTKGIGTGFSTEVLQYNPLHIIAYVRAMLATTSVADRPVIEPYFKGFKGTIRNIGSGATTSHVAATSGAPATNVASATSGAPATNVASATSGAPATNVASATSGAPATNVSSAKYLIKGTYEIIADRKVRITELPIGTWTDDYKEFLEKLMDAPAVSAASDKGKAGTAASSSASSSSAPVLKEYNDMSTDTVVDITVTFHPSYPHTPKDLQAAIIDADAGTNKLEKLLGLFTTQSTTNMNLFDAREKLRKYATIYDIIEDYYVERLSLYAKRKAAMLAQLTNELRVLTNRAKYIQEVLDDKLELRRQTKEAIFTKMTAHGYEHIDGDTEFKYLLKMPMDSVSDENVRHLLSERDTKRAQHQQLADTSIQALWIKDLDELEVEYKKWVAAAEASVVSMASKGGGGGAAAPTKKKMVVKKA